MIKHSKPEFFKINARASSGSWPSNSYLSEKDDDRNMPSAGPRVDNKSRQFSITIKITPSYSTKGTAPPHCTLKTALLIPSGAKRLVT